MGKMDMSASTALPSFSRKRSLSSIGLVTILSSSMGTVQTSAFLTRRPDISRPILPTQSAQVWRPTNHQINAIVFQRKPKCVLQSTTAVRYASVLGISSLPTSWFYLFGLALQFGLQPLLTKAFTPPKIVRSTVIMAQDMARFGICCLVLLLNGSWKMSWQNWCIRGALVGAGIPSVLYMVQNYFALIAYQVLPPVTFNILNQTKTLSAALCCYLILGRRQSAMQIISLFVLLVSALIIEDMVPWPWVRAPAADTAETNRSTETRKEIKKGRKLEPGVIPILIASFLSGLAGAVSQKTLQDMTYNPYVFSMEISAFSFIIMTISLLLGSPDGRKVGASGIMDGWTWKTWIPVVTNAAGGVLVGLVTQHLGVVRKGFALIFGLLLSGLLQSVFYSDEGITREQVVGGILASCSVWIHSKFPPS